jgi:methanogenic corrinoid protein MtbC1
MVADLLERDGWEVIALGADTPAGDLVELIELECPDLVALSTSTAGRLPGVAEVLTALRDVDPRPFVAVGGALFSSGARDLAVELGADLVGADIRQFIARMREEFPPPAGG